jgi:cobalt-zinc-cadmium efflux system outer membrane protein
MRTLIVRAAVVMAFVPAAAGAQSLSLTEAEVLARLSPASPRVQAIRAAADVARADVLAAQRWPNPRLSINRESAVGITEYLTTFGQVLPVTGRRGLSASAASAHADAIASRGEDEVRRLRADARLAFATLAAEQSREGELSVAVGRIRELAIAIAKRESAGDAAGFDRLRAEREALDAEADRVAVSVARTDAQGMLAGFLADVVPGSLIAVASSTTRTPTPRLDELMTRAESTRGELVALQREIESAGFAERAAGRGLYPEPEVVAGTKSSSAVGGDLGSVFAVHATLPLFDHAKPEKTAARARIAQAQASANAFRTALRAQLAALVAIVELRRDTAERYRKAEEGNEELERIAQVSYDAGETGILTLLDAHRTATAARLRQIDLDLASRRAEIELEFASGWEMR